jgi:hypothetical protein
MTAIRARATTIAIVTTDVRTGTTTILGIPTADIAGVE